MARGKQKKAEVNNFDEFFTALEMMESEKGISKEYIAEKIADAIIVASRKEYGEDNVKCNIDIENKVFSVVARKNIVETVTNPLVEITLEEALKIDPKAKETGFVEFSIDPHNFGRVIAQNSRNNFRQGVRDAEKGQTLAEFQSRTKEIVSALVQRVDPRTGNATLLIGKSEATLPKLEQVPGEVLVEGEHIKVYIVDVVDTERGPRVKLSRTHSGLVKRLFETEVPEIFDGTIEIKSVSRQAGSRTKLAVYTKNPEIDAIGACIGPKGARVNNIVDELSGEKIDIVKYSEDPAQYISAALSPARVISVEILSEAEKSCRATVPDSQLSLAIGNKGQNVKLAAHLTGWKIDIRPESGFYGEENEE